jgi:hypothetical protein
LTLAQIPYNHHPLLLRACSSAGEEYAGFGRAKRREGGTIRIFYENFTKTSVALGFWN